MNQGALVGHISPKKDGKSWIYPDSLQDYSNGNKGLAGRPQVESEGGYVSVRSNPASASSLLILINHRSILPGWRNW
ncbi:hypothetical protein THIOM_004158 [Candidatus Thiomargarita nelsonii]|uniref:Uncharacterized protein n=1 Tax=Candidatus Thiomargarita nelsonii TaxID=1003181 RepID=A0A0A6RHU9_9GAMM|nr:hypothetical protein THIOM_004158 [Candidatus Thiomargarita nelsonii]